MLGTGLQPKQLPRPVVKQTTFAPPVMEARRWLQGVTFPDNQPLINVSQAAPVDPPPPALRQAMADAALTRDDAHLYGPVLGMPALRAALSAQINNHYGADTRAENVCITSGCNQAFAAAIAEGRFEADGPKISNALWHDEAMGFNLAPSAETARALQEGTNLRNEWGHYFGAMFWFEGEFYWGVDRMYHLEERLIGLGASRQPDAPLVVPRPTAPQVSGASNALTRRRTVILVDHC